MLMSVAYRVFALVLVVCVKLIVYVALLSASKVKGSCPV
jgi:hypothetical protein